MNHKAKILVIDDEPDMLRSTCKILNSSNYQTFPLSDSNLVESHLKNHNYDLILCDLLMPQTDGRQVLEIVKNSKFQIPVIIFSAYGTVDRAVSCMKDGAYDFIEKPFEADHLLLVVERAINYSQLFQERNELLSKLESQFKFENLVGKSREMLKLFSIIESLAQTGANVLITGESGTGKELVAKCIHGKSSRKLNKFVPINCGALPENLFEAEIFGYEKGAFTGAENRKTGLLEHANKGTFFLDEVGELSQNSQTKLLRVLQERQLRRLGGNEFINIDVRLISATNRNINDLHKNGVMRDDLYYRLNVINIHLPPLRERKEDIQILTEHFFNKNKEKVNKGISGIDPQVISIFENYEWPGNVRELENIIERAIALTKGNIITINDLPTHLLLKKNKVRDFNNMTLKEARFAAIEEIDRQFLTFLLDKHKGNISKISKDTEMTRRNIYHLLKKYNIDPESWRKYK